MTDWDHLTREELVKRLSKSVDTIHRQVHMYSESEFGKRISKLEDKLTDIDNKGLTDKNINQLTAQIPIASSDYLDMNIVAMGKRIEYLEDLSKVSSTLLQRVCDHKNISIEAIKIPRLPTQTELEYMGYVKADTVYDRGSNSIDSRFYYLKKETAYKVEQLSIQLGSNWGAQVIADAVDYYVKTEPWKPQSVIPYSMREFPIKQGHYHLPKPTMSQIPSNMNSIMINSIDAFVDSPIGRLLSTSYHNYFANLWYLIYISIFAIGLITTFHWLIGLVEIVKHV